MKRSIALKILAALGGAALLFLAVGVAAEGFFGVALTSCATKLLASGAVLAVLTKIVLTLTLLTMAWAVVALAMPRRPKQTDYVMQKAADGPIGVSVEAIRKKVMACVARHGEIASAEAEIRQAREGIIVLLTVDQVTGVSIPLSVGLLQKQVRQYVRDCTGVDVLEVRVLVDNRTETQVESAFKVEDTVVPSTPREVAELTAELTAEPTPTMEQLRQMAEKTQPTRSETVKEPANESEPIPVKPVEIPDSMLPEPAAVPDELPEADKPLHQRLFGAEEEPLLVPAPPTEALPVMEAASAEEAPCEVPADEEPSTEETPSAVSDGEDWLEPSMQAAAEALLSDEEETEE